MRKSLLDRQMKDPAFRAAVIVAEACMDLSEQLTALREAQGLTQKALATKLGTGQSVIARFESIHNSMFSLTSLGKLADALGCELKITLRPRRAKSNGEYFDG